MAEIQLPKRAKEVTFRVEKELGDSDGPLRGPQKTLQQIYQVRLFHHRNRQEYSHGEDYPLWWYQGPSVNDRPTVLWTRTGRSKLLHSSVISQCPNTQAHAAPEDMRYKGFDMRYKGFEMAVLCRPSTRMLRSSFCTGVLPEIANYDVQGQQYVCADELVALQTLTNVLNYLKVHKVDICQVDGDFRRGEGMSEGYIKLERQFATIPLPGIDVAFHSGKALCRSVHIHAAELNSDMPVGKHIPNLVTKKFDVSQEYAQLIYDQTSSLRLDKVNGTKTAGHPLSNARCLDTQSSSSFLPSSPFS
ncbi:hypothetical protein PILCRDRAFT_15443 [Piloderma croceum F 1598]|uniref:Uncharacterized protein n=1 Tax=Piloderma croceum (strain F 1598) TaxID=765440 RepID=A0A0C3EZR1_PILCF|nr:hypothetical protein PILCRDRAFT_15443 [Piloderma croceum F 1598]